MLGIILAGGLLTHLPAAPIDCHELVTRHPVVLEQFDPHKPLSVGNGQLAFTVDATGLQTFPESFTDTIPLGTLSDWGWHSFPNPQHYEIDHFKFKEYMDLHGRQVPCADVPGDVTTPEIIWLRANPHRLHLGQIGFVLLDPDRTPARTNDLTAVHQTLDLWNREITSHFVFAGQPVAVETLCDADQDAIAVRVVLPLERSGRLGIKIHFPYGTRDIRTADWTKPQSHTTIWQPAGPEGGIFLRRLDDDTYQVSARWSARAMLTNTVPHEFIL